MIIIKSALNYAAAEKLCSPLKSKIYTPSTDYPEYQVLSHEDQERLELSLCFERDMTNLGIFITLYTGLRIGEICALSWDDIDLQNRVLHVRHTIARIRKDDGRKSNTELILDSPKTKASIRDIPITENLYKVLVNASKHSISRFVVSNSNSFVSPRTYEYRYQKIMELSGVERVNYHCLRHTFATRCIEAGVDIKTLSEILGHANVAVTLNTYVHSSMEMKRNQLEKLHHLQTI